MKKNQTSARQAWIAFLVEYGMTHDLTAGELKALRSIINRLEVQDAGGYDEFRRVLEEPS